MYVFLCRKHLHDLTLLGPRSPSFASKPCVWRIKDNNSICQFWVVAVCHWFNLIEACGLTVCGSHAAISLNVNSFLSEFWGYENCGKCSWHENSMSEFFIQVCSSVSDNEQGSTVLSQSWFFVPCRLSPCSNLGYLAVISLAHCHSYCCCWVGGWVGALWSFCLLLSSLPFIRTPVEVSSEQNLLVGKLPVQELGGHSGSLWGGGPVRTSSHGWTSSGRFIWGGTCCRHVPQKDTGVYGGIPRLQGNKLM